MEGIVGAFTPNWERCNARATPAIRSPIGPERRTSDFILHICT